jgi:hypothetical protein
MPWHKSDAKEWYFFAFRPGLNRNVLIYVRGLYPGVYGITFEFLILSAVAYPMVWIFGVG